MLGAGGTRPGLSPGGVWRRHRGLESTFMYERDGEM